MSKLEKLAQKGVKDPVQQDLRNEKKEWSHDVSTLISQLIAFKRGLNGRGDPQAGLPPSSIKNPLPDEISRYLEDMSRRYEEIAMKAKYIVNKQKDYSNTRRKSQKELGIISSTASVDPKIALAYDDKSTSFSRLITWIVQYPWFKSDFITKSRLDLMYVLADFENQLNDIEYLLSSSTDQSEARSFYEFYRFAPLFERMFIRKFNTTLKAQEDFFKENAPEIGKPQTPTSEKSEAVKIIENKTKEKESQDTVSYLVNNYIKDLDCLSEIKDNLEPAEKQKYEQLHRDMNNMQQLLVAGKNEEVLELYSTFETEYKNLLNILKNKNNNSVATTFEEVVDGIKKKNANLSISIIKNAEKRKMQRWFQRMLLSLKQGAHANARKDAVQNLRDTAMIMDIVQELLQHKNIILTETIEQIVKIYEGLASICDYFQYLAEYNNYEFGVQRLSGKPVVKNIEEHKISQIKKFKVLLTQQASELLSTIQKQAQASMDINLTPKEEEIFSFLNKIVKEKTPETVLRVAGGWVRDKLLGKDSHDIDIAVDNMSGEAFANIVSEYIDKKVSVVKANPEQSKNVETAMINILGVPIDFVGLRIDKYDPNSRIPVVEQASAEDDAKRRDLTINSLFYNINTGEIEDYVGGVEDLKNGIARTPKEPVQTFLDDPLRILRTIRFAAKYNLKLDPNLIEAARLPEIQEAFKNKLSQERIWEEMAGKKEGEGWKLGFLLGPNPVQAMRLLAQLGLRDIVLNLTNKEKEELGLDKEIDPWDTDQNNPHHDLDIWNHSLEVLKELVDKTKTETKEDNELYLIRNITAVLHDIGKRYQGIRGTNDKGNSTFYGHADVSAQMAEKILTRLKAPSSVIQKVVKLIQNHMRLHPLTKEYTPKAGRKYVTDMGDLWESGMDFAIADASGVSKKPDVERYNTLRNSITESMPKGVTKLQRPVTGYDLMELGIKPGPVMGVINKVLDDALLENPNLTKEEALEIARNLNER